LGERARATRRSGGAAHSVRALGRASGASSLEPIGYRVIRASSAPPVPRRPRISSQSGWGVARTPAMLPGTARTRRPLAALRARRKEGAGIREGQARGGERAAPGPVPGLWTGDEPIGKAPPEYLRAGAEGEARIVDVLHAACAGGRQRAGGADPGRIQEGPD